MSDPSELGTNYSLQRPWWRDREQRGAGILAHVNAILNRQRQRRRSFLLFAQLYADLPTMGLGPYAYSMVNETGQTLRMNVVKAVTDTYVSTLTQSNPKPMALSSGGEWGMRRKAKGITRWFEAKADEAGWRGQVSAPCARDQAIFGTGMVKIGIENEGDEERADVMAERVFPWEIVVDDAESQNPAWCRTMYHRKWYDREVLAENFPRKRRDIMASERYSGEQESEEWPSYAPVTANLILVTEAFHKRSSPSADDGIRCLVLPSGVLLAEEKWEDDDFPVIALWRSVPAVGFWGTAIPYELRGIQLSINEILEDLQEALRCVGRPKWMVPNGSVIEDHIDDEIGTIMKFTGQQPPIVYTPNVIPADAYRFLWDQWTKAFEIIGISAQRGGGQIPAGLSGSGASIRAWNDVEGGRMYEASKLWEEWHVNWGRRAIDVARRVAAIRPDYASKYRRKTYVEVIKFADFELDEYTVSLYPVSKLSMMPGQRLAQVDELFSKQIIDQREYRKLLDFPDLQAENDLANGAAELTDKLIERFLDAEDPADQDIFIYPEPEWDLAYMRKRFQLAYINASLEDAPEENKALLSRFIVLCDEAMNVAAPPPQGPMPSEGPSPEAMPPLPPPDGMPPMPGDMPMPPPPTGIAA